MVFVGYDVWYVLISRSRCAKIPEFTAYRVPICTYIISTHRFLSFCRHIHRLVWHPNRWVSIDFHRQNSPTTGKKICEKIGRFFWSGKVGRFFCRWGNRLVGHKLNSIQTNWKLQNINKCVSETFTWWWYSTLEDKQLLPWKWNNLGGDCFEDLGGNAVHGLQSGVQDQLCALCSILCTHSPFLNWIYAV